jgi:integrase
MTTVHRSTRAPREKPKKPYEDFPLFPHANGLWAKKIRGRLYYFGVWSDPDAALKKFVSQRDDLYAGRMPRAVNDDGMRLKELCNRFLTTKRHMLDLNELTLRSFEDYYRTCERLIKFFGPDRRVDDLAVDDFERLRVDLAKTRGPTALGTEITRVRVVMKYAHDQGLVQVPVRYGQSFRKPSRKVLLRERYKRGPRMFEADVLRMLIEKSKAPLKAMILLGINCGFGPTDLARLPKSVVDLKKGWVDYPRPKTGVHRRCLLWPETITAIEEALAVRPEPKAPEHSDLVFITKFGQPWTNERQNNAVSPAFRLFLQDLDLHRKGLGFYALRHGFETIGGDSLDQVAVDHIMGHVRNDMASVYRERISDERLKAVTDHIHRWLFEKKPKPR